MKRYLYAHIVISMTKKQPEKILSLKTGHFLEKKVYFTGWSQESPEIKNSRVMLPVIRNRL